MSPLFSNVSSQLKAIFQEQSSQPLSLRQGQVILGKIKEILPNNVAVVQFGKHQMTASLEIPINADQPYLFEVLSLGDLPQLKVITHANSNFSVNEQVEQILANLNINPSKEQLQFINELINNEIPFRQTELTEALALFKDDPSQATKEELIGMLKNHLPITKTTLSAIKAINTNQSLTSQMEALTQALKSETNETQITQQLLQKLAVMITNESTRQFSGSVKQEQIDALNRLLESNPNSQTEALAQTEPNENNSGHQREVAEQSIVNQLTRQIGLTDRQVYQLNKLLNQLEDLQTTVPVKLTEQLHTLLTNDTLNHKIMHQLPTEATQSLEAFIQQPTADLLTEFIQPLKELIDIQIPPKNQNQIFHLLGEMSQAEPNLFPVKEQFLIHFKNHLLNVGLDFEQKIYEEGPNATEQQTSLKQMLLQAISEQTSYTNEAEQIVNLLTGQQLTLLHEDARFLHLSTVIPNIFGMQEDIEVEFYSRKDQDEKIDTDYCRIAFYLELEELKTTIIDVNVQNRLIHLTVYNNHDIALEAEKFKQILKEGLEQFNYTLSTLSHKPLPDEKQSGMKRDAKQSLFQTSQLDVRI